MSPDLLRRLRDADPAEAMPPQDPASRDALRRALVSGARTSAARAPRPLLRRRLSIAAAAIAAILVLGGSAYGASVILDWPAPLPPGHGLTALQVQRQYDVWRTKIELPPGATWQKKLLLPTDTTYGSREGAAQAVTQAMGAWAVEWQTAAEAGDRQRVETAMSQLASLRASIPVSTDGNDSGTGIWDTSTAEYYDAVIAAAKQGHLDRLKWVAEWAARIDPAWFWAAQRHWVEFVGGGPAQVLYKRPQFLAEYRAAQANFDLPPGRRWPTSPSLPNNLPMEKGSGYLEAALTISWAYWWQEWVDAAKAGDQQRIEAADKASRRLEKLLPRDPKGSPTYEWLALEDKTIADFRTVVAHARRGDMKPMKDWLWVQHAWLAMK